MNAEVDIQPDFNPFTPEFAENPYPTYQMVRAMGRLVPLPGSDVMMATHYEDINQILKDKRFGHKMRERMVASQGEEMANQPAYKTLFNMMLTMDAPEHTRLRGLVFKTFSARRMQEMRPRIQAIADGLIDKIIEQGEMDIMRDYAQPLPAIVICELLGIPKEDRAQFVNESTVNGRILDPTPMTPEELADTNTSFLEMEAYFEDICGQRLKDPQDDLLTALVQSENEDGKLSKEELVANIFLLFGAGHETTVNLIGNGLLALFKHPDQLELLKSDFSLMPNAVEEFLRYDSSVQLTSRVALEDVEFAGQTIPKDSEVLTLLGAGNRDPEMFADPDKLDITRPGVKPLSFGGGIHFCLGAQLARIEGAIALETLLRRLPNLQLAEQDNPAWKITMTLRGLTTLPATW